jgi:hypothetical protein
MINCKHDFKIKIKSSKEDLMIELECKKCDDYFVMSQKHFYNVLQLKDKINKLLVIKFLK